MLINGSLLALTGESSDFARIVTELQGTGITVRRATDLLDAILAHLSSPADVIVCDADTPEWRQTVDWLRHLARTVPVIVLARHPDPQRRRRILECGACEVLDKSFQRFDLQWAAIQLLGARQTLAAAS